MAKSVNYKRSSGLRPMWDKKQIHKVFEKLQERAEEYILQLLIRTGDKFITIARDEGQYDDWTGNLRSSIGYVIVKDGQIVGKSSFEKVQGAGENTKLVNFKTKDGKTVKYATKGASGDGSEGKKEGEQLAMDLVKTFTKGYVLIGVAGMKYAVFVEAMENKDVLTNAANKAEDFIKKESQLLFNRLGI